MKKLFLHMGFHKTATTSFQHTCASNRLELESQGFIYPLFYCEENPEENPITNHSLPLYSCFSKDPSTYHMNIKLKIKNIDYANQQYIRQLEQAFDGDHNMIVSGEDISLLKPESLGRLISFFEKYRFEIIPIILVRSPYSLHCSNLQQQVKDGWHIKFTNFISQKESIVKFKKIFGKKINFISFSEACQHRKGPVAFLLDYMGVDSTKITIINRNPGLSNKFIRFQNYLNKYQPAILNDKVNLKHIKAKRYKGEKFYLTEEELNEIIDQLHQENSFFSKELGPRFCDTEFKTSSDLNFYDPVAYDPKLFFSISKNLSIETIDFLRNQAISVEDKNPKLAFELMSLAYEARPIGPFVKNKLDRYLKLIDENQ